jgi:hypothetical protein
MSPSTVRPARRYTLFAAVGAALGSPLLALSYFATEQGASSREEAFLGGWIEPARGAAGSLLTFASADGVYAVYMLVLAVLFPAVALAAFTARSLRPSERRGAERWGWGLALTGYSVFGAGLALVALLLVALGPDAAVVDVLFMGLTFPGLLISLIGSTVLGIGLVRRAYRPRSTAWLLTLAVPLWILGSVGLGHNSLGMLPLFIAWALTARDWDADPIELESASPRAVQT